MTRCVLPISKNVLPLPLARLLGPCNSCICCSEVRTIDGILQSEPPITELFEYQYLACHSYTLPFFLRLPLEVILIRLELFTLGLKLISPSPILGAFLRSFSSPHTIRRAITTVIRTQTKIEVVSVEKRSTIDCQRAIFVSSF